jgi:hypothetical protein
MADVTISSLTQGIPAGSDILPYSTGSSTLGVPVSAIFQNTNRVGIGTSSPIYPIEIVDNNLPYIVLRGSNSNVLAMYGGTTAIDYSVVHSGIGKDLNISSNGGSPTNGLYIKASGNVGIGTLSPSQKLDVAGTVNATNIFKGGSEVPIGIGGMKLFTAAGANTWTVPNLITKIKITVIGGGAGGGPSGGNAGGSSSITNIDITAGAGNGITPGAAAGSSSIIAYSAGGTSGILSSTTTNPGFKLLGITSFGSGGATGSAGGSSGGTGAYAIGVATVTPGATLTVNVGAGGSAKSGSGNSQSGSAGCVLIEW